MRMKNEEAWESQSSNDESLVTKNVFINGKMEERVIAFFIPSGPLDFMRRKDWFSHSFFSWSGFVMTSSSSG